MPKGTNVKPTHKAVKTYYAALAAYADQSVEHEGAVRSAFQNLLADTGRTVGPGATAVSAAVPLHALSAIPGSGARAHPPTVPVRRTDDDLEAEIKKKIKRGYRLTITPLSDFQESRLDFGACPDILTISDM